MRPDCPHWSDCGVVDGGCCRIGLHRRRPSFGGCNNCVHNQARGQMPLIQLTVKPRDRLDGIPLPGDLIAAAAKRIGADRLAKLWERWTGLACGCGERQKKINEATIRLMKWAGFEASPADGKSSIS